MAKVRAARAAEAQALTGLVMRSKAHWGYRPEALAAWAGELRIRPADVTARRIVVAEDGEGTVFGVASLDGAAALASLGLLFVERWPSGGAWGGCCTGTCCAGRRSWGCAAW